MFSSSSKKPSRIGQWDGRRRSSRSDEPIWAQLSNRQALLRLTAVLVTTALVTAAAFRWGPTQTPRVGQVCPHDLRARVKFEVVDQTRTLQKRDAAVEALPEPIRNDPRAIEAARAGVPVVVDPYPLGSLLVPRGQPIARKQIDLLEAERKA